MIRHVAVTIVGAMVLSLAAADPALAVSVWTLDAPVDIVTGGNLPTLDGTIDPAPTLTLEESDAVCLDGLCDKATQDWFIFKVSITAGSLDEISMASLFDATVGMGFFQGANTDPLAFPASNRSVATDPLWAFTGLTGMSDYLFAAFPDGTFPNFTGTAEFMVSEVGDAGNETFSGGTTPIELPEPSTIALVGIGLGIGWCVRRRRL